MRNVLLYMSMSLDGLVASDREHPGIAISDPESTRTRTACVDFAAIRLSPRCRA